MFSFVGRYHNFCEGDTISTVEDVQYYGGIFTVGVYHQYIGLCLVSWGVTTSTVLGDNIITMKDTISTVKNVLYYGGIFTVRYTISVVKDMIRL